MNETPEVHKFSVSREAYAAFTRARHQSEISEEEHLSRLIDWFAKQDLATQQRILEAAGEPFDLTTHTEFDQFRPNPPQE